ncbi:MAG: Fe-S cluster assembly protein SufD [Rhodospirillales bacterium]|nr:Fe-S cluster assembly protein SufD [Rhodospirillales bacterium]MDH3793410.1 Fe-S cluster assembly protein SufD [Rhodospirillales bacterium]
MTTAGAQPFVEQYGALKGALPGVGLPWLAELREAGLARFASLGLPTPRDESWKYTNLRPLEKVAFGTPNGEAVSIDRLPSLLPAGASENRLVFVNGHYRADLSTLKSLREGVEIGSLAAGLERSPETVAEYLGQIAPAGGAAGEQPGEQPLLALNTALSGDGLMLRLGRGAKVKTPIEVIFIGAATEQALAYHPRNLIVLEPESQAVVIEHHVSLGGGATFANSATEIELGDGALLHHYKMQAEGPEAFHVSTVHARVGRDAHYDSFGMSLGSRLSRNEVSVRLNGQGANCHLNGAYMVRGKQHCDTTTLVEHLVPRTSCREVFKGVLDDEARAVFQGRIVVHPDAQQSDGHQLSKAMLLSERAEIDIKPELEIYADDVKCSHGATAGDLDHEALFYLRSRGLPEGPARRLLIEAFLTESIEAIAAEDLCPAFLASIADWLKT